MTTLKSKWYFALLAAVLYVTAPLVDASYYVIQQGRGAYPPDADTIAIPIFQFAIALLIVSPVYAVAVWLAIRSYQGGRSLLAFDTTRPVRSVLWSVVLAGAVFCAIYEAVFTATKLSLVETGASLLWTYLLLCLRSSLAGGGSRPEYQAA